MLDVTKARAETPAVESGIYLNNASCSLMPQPVIDAVQDYFALEAKIGGYPALMRDADIFEAVYESVAALINAKPNEIALMGSQESHHRPFPVAVECLRRFASCQNGRGVRDVPAGALPGV